VKIYRSHVMVCMGTSCVVNGAVEVKEALKKEIQKHGLGDEIGVFSTGCTGLCGQGPVVLVRPEGILYHSVDVRKIPKLVEEHFLKGRPFKELMYTPAKEKEKIPNLSDIDFFRRQRLVVLRNRGLIDPTNIDDYIAHNGFSALAKALTEMEPADVISEILKSGLRGRGGGGFRTGEKWKTAASEPREPRFVICNADEGDPSSFKDRSIIETDPFNLLEGITICGYAIGAEKGYVYTRFTYKNTIEYIENSIAQMREKGLLGERIFDTDFNFDIEVFQNPGALVGGEATGIISAMEGRRIEPRSRPPHVAQYGLHGQPTVINNVETFSNVPQIILRGAPWFSEIGTHDSKGTKIFAISGCVKNVGVMEVPFGTTLHEMIYEIGGGLEEGKELKAVQTGGANGGLVPAELLDITMDYESLRDAGSMICTGGVVAMDQDTCMVEVARHAMEFSASESCGKCTPCREGTKWMSHILKKITEGKCTPEEFGILEFVADSMVKSSLCGLGKSAANPVLTTLKHFRSEYEAHVLNNKCPAKVCRPLLTFTIDKQRCVEDGHGCDQCRRNCASEAILGEKGKPHEIIQDKCIKCGVCRDVCNFDAVLVE
jgi:NADP-reducing hydrogenase subunit HndC